FCTTFRSTYRHPPSSTLFPYTTLFRSVQMHGMMPGGLVDETQHIGAAARAGEHGFVHMSGRRHTVDRPDQTVAHQGAHVGLAPRSEEHTSELQSRENLVCRLLLEKKKN